MTTQITTFVTPYTTVPSRQSPSTFSADRDVRLQEEATRIPQQNSMATEMNAVAVEVNTNTLTATTQAGIATAQAVIATTQAGNASSSANYMGEWDDLTGAANKPYSVFHNGGYWALNTNLADITAKEPGVDVEWDALSVLWEIIVSNTTAVASRGYMCDTSGGAFTLTLPATPVIGDTVVVLDISSSFSTYNLTVGRNGEKIMELDEDMTVATKNAGFTLIYSSATYGWRII